MIGREWKRGNCQLPIGVLDFQVMPESEQIAVLCFLFLFFWGVMFGYDQDSFTFRIIFVCLQSVYVCDVF